MNTGAKGVTGMRLFGGGVLQINDAANATLWQSGDNPTDTLLLGQFLRVGDMLVSRSSPYNLSQGIYSLQVRAEGLGLYVRGTDPASSELYWMWNIYNKSALALDQNCSGISFNVSILWPDSSLGLRFLNYTSVRYFIFQSALLPLAGCQSPVEFIVGCCVRKAGLRWKSERICSRNSRALPTIG